MVQEQIEHRGIRDTGVLKAMLKIPRHYFVPPPYEERAYNDAPLPIGGNQTISQPYIVAYMSQALELRKGQKVLEVGTGSGYQTAVLSELGGHVCTMEFLPELSEQAKMLLREMGYASIRFHVGNGWKGWPEEAPFDRILVTAAAEKISPALVDQLKERGRMVVPVGRDFQQLVIGVKEHGVLQETETIAVRFVPLVKAEKS